MPLSSSLFAPATKADLPFPEVIASAMCDHLNPDGTFKGGFDGCVLHMQECEGYSKESATKICGAITAHKD